VQPIAGYLVPPRLSASPWTAGSFFSAKVLSYDPKAKIAIVLLENEVFQVRAEASLETNQILHLVAEKNSAGKLVWKILTNPANEKDRALSEWRQSFLKLNLSVQPDRIQFRRLFFSTPEWGAQAEARHWPDSAGFISEWTQAEALLNLGSPELSVFPQLTPEGQREIDQWNSARIQQFPLLRLYPIQFYIKGQPKQGWIKTWSLANNYVFRWTFLSASFDVPILLTFHSTNITLRFLKKTDERIFVQNPSFNLNIQKILGRSFKWNIVQNSIIPVFNSLRGIDVHA
jgi:hypothetical protein